MSKPIIDVRAYQTHGKKCKLYEFPNNFVIIDNSQFNNLVLSFALITIVLGVAKKNFVSFIKNIKKRL